MSLSSLRRVVRRLGYGWKRLRRGLKARRDAVLFALFQQELTLLYHAEARGELAVVYADECRFSRHAPVPYAWQRRGQPPVVLPAERGAGGYSVLGLWQAKAPDQPLLSYVLSGALTADLFTAVLDEFSQHLARPTVLVLDNASVHRAACVQARRADWAARGLRLQFLPALLPRTQQNRAALAPLQTLLVDACRLRNRSHLARKPDRVIAQGRKRIYGYFCLTT